VPGLGLPVHRNAKPPRKESLRKPNPNGEAEPLVLQQPMIATTPKENAKRETKSEENQRQFQHFNFFP
jgi:hypothetical protein